MLTFAIITLLTGAEPLDGSAALNGTGTVSARAVVIRKGATALSGVGTAAAAAGLRRPASSALTGTGTAAAAGRLRARSPVALLGAGFCEARSGAGSTQAAAALNGQGTLSVVAHVRRPAAAALAGLGTASASAIVIRGGRAVLAGLGVAAAAGRWRTLASASLSGAGTVSATGTLPDRDFEVPAGRTASVEGDQGRSTGLTRVFKERFDPSDSETYALNFAPKLDTEESITAFSWSVSAVVTAWGFSLRDDGAFAPGYAIDGQLVRIVPMIAAPQQHHPRWNGFGQRIEISGTVTTNAVPPRTVQRTFILSVRQR